MEFHTYKPVHELEEGVLDVRLEGGARGLFLSSGTLGGHGLIDSSDDEAYEAGIRGGLWLTLDLMDKFPCVVRVRVGEPTDREEAEWLGRLCWKVSVPCGTLVVACGTEYLYSDLDPAYRDEFAEFVRIEPGDYALTVLSYITSVNGDDCMMRADGVGWQDLRPVGTWFRETRPGEDFPDWLRARLLFGPGSDPGHEAEWEALFPTEEGERLRADWQRRTTVDHVVLLAPLEEAPAEPALEYGALWYQECRRPPTCPLGIPASATCVRPG